MERKIIRQMVDVYKDSPNTSKNGERGGVIPEGGGRDKQVHIPGGRSEKKRET